MTEREKEEYNPRTLCEVCAKASGHCPWSEKDVQKPVEGWDAIRHDLGTFARKYGKRVVSATLESYIVLDCPLFVLEEHNRWAYEKFDREAIRKQYGKGDAG